MNPPRLLRVLWDMTTPILPADHADRLARARLALDGLSVGDALGETCFQPDNWAALIDDPRATARGPWPWTDDTAMALGLYEVLDRHGRIDQDDLARTFAARFRAEPFRGYGGGAVRLLGQIEAGADWRAAADTLFNGGSFGNGSAMRIAPLAGYFAEDGYERVAEQATLSAAVTHAHPEGVAGGVAAAVAGAYAWLNRDRRSDPAVKRGLFDAVLAHTPAGEVRDGIERAAGLTFDVPAEPTVRLLDHGMSVVPFDISLETVVRQLGNGSRIICQDTVPFCLWVAARHRDDYEAAVVNTIRAGGDIDTTAAIVGGIVGLAVGRAGIPADWLADREEVRV
ncbi:MAG: ADP-ribosylglycohydrolase family protein [Gemmataceae bacterium]|nr:ADP-ribosylglycohydrolase family protein [Gemmataceae bacterium]